MTQVFSFCPLLRINFRTLVASGALAPLSACPLQLPVHHRVSQLKSNLTKFQYAISVRLKLKPNEQDKYQSVVFQFVIVVLVGALSVPSARSPHGVSRGRPSFDDSLPVFPTVARHSPPPSSAARDAAPRGRAGVLLVVPTWARHWKAAQGGSEFYGCRCSNG